MTSIPAGQRPRERLLSLGPDSLADAELVAVLLGTGSPREVRCRWPTSCWPTTAARTDWRGRSRRGWPDASGWVRRRRRASWPASGWPGGSPPYRPAPWCPAPPTSPPRSVRGCSTPGGSASCWSCSTRGCASGARSRSPKAAATSACCRSARCSPPRSSTTGRRSRSRTTTRAVTPTPSRADEEVTGSLQRAADAVGLDFLAHLVLGGDRWVLCDARPRRAVATRAAVSGRGAGSRRGSGSRRTSRRPGRPRSRRSSPETPPPPRPVRVRTPAGPGDR